MTVETQRNNIVHRILVVQNVQLLSKIEDLLDNDVFLYKTNGIPLSINEYKNHLTKIMIASDSGEIGYTTQEAKSKIIRK